MAQAETEFNTATVTRERLAADIQGLVNSGDSVTLLGLFDLFMNLNNSVMAFVNDPRCNDSPLARRVIEDEAERLNDMAQTVVKAVASMTWTLDREARAEVLIRWGFHCGDMALGVPPVKIQPNL